MGYNGVLCSIALGNKNLKSLVWTSCSVLLSVVLQVIGMNLGITTLTAPFVILKILFAFSIKTGIFVTKT